MMTKKTLKALVFIHKWTSLLCTLFLLELCVTGLPLIFSDEINSWVSPKQIFEQVPAGTPTANLDEVVRAAHQRYPNQFLKALFLDDEDPAIWMSVSPTQDANDDLIHFLQFDSRTAKILQDNPPFSEQPETFLSVIDSLHTNLFMSLPGELFVGFMGIVFLASTISGILLYGPFMKKIDFGTVRYERSRYLKWLDLHNLTGIVLAVWMVVVGATGVMNELSKPLFGLWQQTDVQNILAPYKDGAVVSQENLASIQHAFDVCQRELPDAVITTIMFPGQETSPYHYVLWTKGNTPLTAQLFTPVLVDARNGQLSMVASMPWYLRTLEISRPLHFGDYGGLPLKILWALFDVVMILVLISGLYLWFAKRKSRNAGILKLIDESDTTNK